eukprot:TRINITY_DN9479_c0_g2_i1.p1 TRINITY_DN9479_c0_g2~~TRINITY_DN9479_c0_g2_i1.p1  ORF type:complete len:1070 (+),score=169.31 TRINITY_DN9479_c0_g2_i1:64-3273(+)
MACPTDPDQPAGGSYKAYIDAYGSEEGGLVKYRVIKRYTQRPCLCFVQACAVHWVLFVLFVVLNASVGSSYLALSVSDFGLHLWEDTYKIRLDAVSEGRKLCRFNPLNDASISQQEGAELSEIGSYTVEIVYKAKDGNMLTKENLERVMELEDYIASHVDYAKFCKRRIGVSLCEPVSSVVSACHPPLVGPQDCSSSKSRPTGLVDCSNRRGCARSQWTLNETFINLKLQGYAQASFNATPETSFLNMVDASFGGSSQAAKATRSSFKFGFPICMDPADNRKCFTATDDRPLEQQALIESFFSEVFSKKLFTYNSDNPDNGFVIGFSGGNLFTLSFMATLQGDARFLVLAFLAVLLYVMFMTGSLFLAVISMLQIFACFFSGFHLYRLLFGNPYLGIFHVQAIFLIAGIGVDDVFVFLDHFEAAARADPAHKTNLWARLSWTWKYSSVAMGVTSITTSVSFFMNGLSGLPGMASFGIFAGSMVVIMYISMCFYFPAAVCFNQRFFKHKQFCFGIEHICNRMCANTSTVRNSDHQEKHKPVLVRFFEHQFSRFILNHRVKILLVFLVGIGIHFGTNLPKLVPEKEVPPSLPDSHPVQILIDAYRYDFVREGGSLNTEVNIVFGFDPSTPLNREGTDKLGINFGKGSASNGAGGTINWNSKFSEVGQHGMNMNIPMAMPCWIQLCDAAEIRNSDRDAGGYEMKGCWPRALKKTADDMDSTGALWAAAIGPNPGDSFWRVMNRTEQEQGDAWMRDEVKPYVFGVESNVKAGNPIWKWAFASMKLSSSSTIGPAAGIELIKKWEEWLSAEMSRGACREEVTSGLRRGDILTPMIGSPGFAAFKRTDKLMSEMIQGLAISIAVALVVLVGVTGNVITGGLAALTIALIVVCVLAMVPVMGWELGVSQVIGLIMVPGLSVDFTAHLAEAYMGAKHHDREHRLIHALEHSGVSVVSGAVSTLLASGSLLFCTINYFKNFGTMIFITIWLAIIFSLFFFPSMMALIGPVGYVGDWHHFVSSKLKRDLAGEKEQGVSAQKSQQLGENQSAPPARQSQECEPVQHGPQPNQVDHVVVIQ